MTNNTVWAFDMTWAHAPLPSYIDDSNNIKKNRIKFLTITATFLLMVENKT